MPRYIDRDDRNYLYKLIGFFAFTSLLPSLWLTGYWLWYRKWTNTIEDWEIWTIIGSGGFMAFDFLVAMYYLCKIYCMPTQYDYSSYQYQEP